MRCTCAPDGAPFSVSGRPKSTRARLSSDPGLCGTTVKSCATRVQMKGRKREVRGGGKREKAGGDKRIGEEPQKEKGEKDGERKKEMGRREKENWRDFARVARGRAKPYERRHGRDPRSRARSRFLERVRAVSCHTGARREPEESTRHARLSIAAAFSLRENVAARKREALFSPRYPPSGRPVFVNARTLRVSGATRRSGRHACATIHGGLRAAPLLSARGTSSPGVRGGDAFCFPPPLYYVYPFALRGREKERWEFFWERGEERRRKESAKQERTRCLNYPPKLRTSLLSCEIIF